MKNTKEIKNANFHKQINGEKIREAATVLLLLNDSNNTIIYDIIANKTNEQLQKRITEIKTNNILGVSYIAVTEKNSFVEYKRLIMTSK